jgi:hypothetical protein
VKVPGAHSANLLSLSAAADEVSHRTANARARMFSQSPKPRVPEASHRVFAASARAQRRSAPGLGRKDGHYVFDDLGHHPGRTSGANQPCCAYAVSMASLSERTNESQPNPRRLVHCLACGKSLEAPLSAVGSLRCMDCRDEQAALSPELVALWQKRGSHI